MKKLAMMLRAVQNRERPLVLIASLPQNDPELAQAALSGGADCLKVHLHLTHRASGTVLGDLVQERENLEKILAVAGDCPVGIVPKADADLQPDEMHEIAAMGFDFLSLYADHAPVSALPNSDKIDRMLALSCLDGFEIAKQFLHLPIQMAELSIMKPETYGQPFTYRDLAQVRAYAEWVRPLPTVLPTQHKILPEMVGEIATAGVCGVMIGVISAGTTPNSWLETFRDFRKMADQGVSIP